MVRPRYRRLLAATAAAAILAAGCSASGGSSAAAPAGPPEKPDITVAAVPTLDEAGLYVAQQRGIFARYGLHVKIVPVASSADVISRQAAGKGGIDISAGNYVSYILAAAKGAKLKILAAGSIMGPNVQMIMVAAHSPIGTLTQLINQPIAVNARQNIGALLVDSVFNNNAILPGKQTVKFSYMPFPSMINALKTGQVAAAWMPEPFVTEAEETIGAQPVSDADTGTTQNLPIAGYVATEQWAKQYPRTAAAFKAAILQGQQIADTSVLAVQNAMIQYAHVPADAAPIVASPSYPLRLDPASIQRVSNLMLQFGILKQGFSTAQMTSP